MDRHQEFYDEFYEKRIRTSRLGDWTKVTERLRQHIVSVAIARFRPRLPVLRLLDVGCGRGQLTPYLSRYGDVLGLDYSHTAVNYCRNKYPRAHFEAVDVLQEPWSDRGSFHVVVSTEVVEHVPRERQQEFVAILWSLVERGGILLLTTPDRATADHLKTDPTLDDEEYYRQYEGQPVASLLYRTELAALRPPDAEVCQLRSYSPVISCRPLDLLLKVVSAPFKYVPLQWIGDLGGLPCKSQILVIRKT